jgi:putative glycosyltransferase (TIGR04372 family)
MCGRHLLKVLRVLTRLPVYLLAVPAVLAVRLLAPWYLVRFDVLVSHRLGHFAANTEIYLCERDAGVNVPPQRHVDLFCMYEPVSNQQLAAMWRRVLHVWPSWLLAPLIRLNKLLPGGAKHEIGRNTQNERDIFNLLDKFPPHLAFTAAESQRGEQVMRAMGIPPRARVVCLMVRDDAYLAGHIRQNWDGHRFRNSDIQNYAQVAEELAARGYFVVRMGAQVSEAFAVSHPRVIDYATNGARSDFMDIYLAEQCELCISTGTGWDSVAAWVFRKPAVFVNYSVMGLISSYTERFIFLPKMYHDAQTGACLPLSEIFSRGAGFVTSASGLASLRVELVENTPEEIRDACIEMVDRLNGAWQRDAADAGLQRRFLEIFPVDALDACQGRRLHGEFRALIGAAFLRKNRDWLR